MGTSDTAAMNQAGLCRLMTWLSPAFPVGAYSYSHGIEWAVEAGLLRDRAGLSGWVGDVLRHGAGRIDAALFLAAHRALTADDEPALRHAAEIGDVMRGTAETALESAAQGRAFLATVRTVWPDPRLDRLDALCRAEARAPAYAVAAGAAAAVVPVAEGPALAAFLTAVAANLVSAGVRLIPLGQTDGMRAVAALEAVVLDCAAAALARPAGDIGGAAVMVDRASALHETQHTRLFRS